MATDMTGGFAQSMPLRGDLHARLQDILARKDLPFSSQLEALIHLAESTLSRERLRALLHGLVGRFRRDEPLGEESGRDAEWARLKELIQRAGREGTIESYGEYLFTVGVSTSW